MFSYRHHTLQKYVVNVSVSVFHIVALFIFMEFSYFMLRKKKGGNDTIRCVWCINNVFFVIWKCRKLFVGGLLFMLFVLVAFIGVHVYELHGRCLIRSMDYLPLASTHMHQQLLYEFRVVLLCVLTFCVPCDVCK